MLLKALASRETPLSTIQLLLCKDGYPFFGTGRSHICDSVFLELDGFGADRRHGPFKSQEDSPEGAEFNSEGQLWSWWGSRLIGLGFVLTAGDSRAEVFGKLGEPTGPKPEWLVGTLILRASFQNERLEKIQLVTSDMHVCSYRLRERLWGERH